MGVYEHPRYGTFSNMNRIEPTQADMLSRLISGKSEIELTLKGFGKTFRCIYVSHDNEEIQVEPDRQTVDLLVYGQPFRLNSRELEPKTVTFKLSEVELARC